MMVVLVAQVNMKEESFLHVRISRSEINEQKFKLKTSGTDVSANSLMLLSQTLISFLQILDAASVPGTE